MYDVFALSLFCPGAPLGVATGPLPLVGRETLHQTKTSLIMLVQRRILSAVRPWSVNQVRHGTSIPVILLEEVQNKGREGEIVEVKRGFARNYLVPRKLAGKHIHTLFLSRRCILTRDICTAYATAENKQRYIAKSDGTPVLRQPVANISEQIRGIPKEKLVISAPVNWNGSVFVSPTDIRKLLEANGVFLDTKSTIQFDEPVKTAGSHSVQVAGTSLTVEVVAQDRK